MALEPIKFLPGIYTEETDRGAHNRWKDGDHVRWFKEMPQKIGGWAKATTNTFLGLCRGIIDWKTLAFSNLIALGTHLKLYVNNGGTFYDITPIRLTVNPMANNPFAAVNTTPTITVTHVAHAALVGDYVTYSNATAVATVTINGEFAVATIVDADHYTFTAASNANATASGGGAGAIATYQISIGTVDSRTGLGWGGGTFGASTYGTPRTSSGFVNMCRIWSLDNWGEDLVASPRGGAIYVWDASTGTGTRAVIITNAPSTAKAVLVSKEDRHMIALGAHDGSVSDALLIRWCSSEDYTDWTPGASDTAGRKRLDGGNEILCGIKVGQEILVFTDSDLTSMVFEGPPYTFGFYSKGTNGVLMGPNAAVEFDGRGWWMGESDFFVYDGRARVLPCDVRNYVFEDFNFEQKAKVFAFAVRQFGEVWWLYPSEDSTECDLYVAYNVLEKHWTYGTIVRTAFVGDSKLFAPYATGTDGYLYDHENTVNAAGAALASSLDSWDIELGNGDDVMHISKLVPDFKTLSGSVDLTVKGRGYPQASEQTSQSQDSIISTTEFINPHMRARQISLSFSTSDVDDHFRMGTLRIEAQPDGKQ